MGEDLKPARPAVFTLPASGAGPAPFFSRQLVVGKALLNSPPTKQVTESQQALASFLARKRERYKNRLNTSSESKGGDRSSTNSLRCFIPASRSTPAELSGRRGSSNYLHESKCILRIASLDSQTLYSHSNGANGNSNEARWINQPGRREGYSQKDGNISISSDFAKLGSEELADRVVSHARLRRRNKRRTAVIQREIQRPVINLHHRTDLHQQRPAVPILRTSTPIPLGSTHSQSPTKREGGTEPRARSLSLSRSQDGLETTESLRGSKMTARKVVFLSEKQSATAKDTGIPNVPPSTPREGEQCISQCLAEVTVIVQTPHFTQVVWLRSRVSKLYHQCQM